MLKTKLTLLFSIVFVVIINAQVYYISVGSSIYRINPITCSSTLICSSLSINTGGGTTSGTINDIAFSPSGTLYGVMGNYFFEIDTSSCVTTFISNQVNSANCLAIDAAGNIYAADGSGVLYSVNPTTGVFTSLGTIPCPPAGDLSFVGTELYVSCINGDLIHVDISNPSASTIVGNISSSLYFFGLWADYADCNSMAVFAIEYNGQIFQVDTSNANSSLVCDIGLTGIGGAATILGGNPCLPITLSSISSSCDGRDVTLNWTTLSEQNADKFFIEKRRSDGTWAIVGKMNASGNSSVPKHYTFADYGAAGNLSYYRLRLVDFNGGSQNYNPISVACDVGVNNIQVYPNPNNGEFIVQISSQNKIKDATIQIISVEGKIVASKGIDIVSGITEIHFDNTNLASGMYVLKVSEKNKALNPIKIIIR